MQKQFIAILALAAACSGSTGYSSASTLLNDTQRDREALALKVLANPTVQGEIGKVEKLYEKSSPAGTPSGRQSLPTAARCIALASVQYALSDDGSHPAIMWAVNAPHTWSGLDVPRSGYGIDNPDNVYRQAAIDGNSRYEVKGRVKQPGPIQETFILYSSIPGMNPMSKEGGGMVGTLRSDQMSIAPDGSFTITIDSDPANGRPNHIQSNETAKLLIIRDTLSDWAKQNPVALEIHRVSGPAPSSPPSEDALAHRAAEIMHTIAPFWVRYFDQFDYAKPANHIETPWAREGGWGFASGGHFSIGKDEALVVTLDRVGAGYLGFQLSDPWGVAPQYGDRNGSLNQAQAKPNPDGTYTYVVSATDPGVYNWLDTSGLQAGMFAIRWQAVPSGAHASHAVREAKVMKLSELKAALPATAFVDAAGRAAQLQARSVSYQRRLAE